MKKSRRTLLLTVLGILGAYLITITWSRADSSPPQTPPMPLPSSNQADQQCLNTDCSILGSGLGYQDVENWWAFPQVTCFYSANQPTFNGCTSSPGSTCFVAPDPYDVTQTMEGYCSGIFWQPAVPIPLVGSCVNTWVICDP